MAHLSTDDRGQILLVAAFALAIIFVAMALIVNSAIFTENLASRGETAGSDGALSMRAQVEANVGDAVGAANRNNVSDLTNALDDSVRNISEQTGQQSAMAGRVVDIETDASRTGVRIAQENDWNFTNGADAEEYKVVGDINRVADANGTRAFEIRASDMSSASDNSSAFTIRVQESGSAGNVNSWRTRIWNESTSETVRVRTWKNDGTTTDEVCEVPYDSGRPTVRIDVTGGTVNGEECDALGTGPSGENFHFGAGTEVDPGTSDTYDISFENAHNVNGTFSMVVYNQTGSPDLDLSNIGTDIEYSKALYDVTVDYTYLTSDLRYETAVRVAPGEPDV